ncbi:hypothetical protein EHV15_35470 [Paenibacillus oralis]|uniref:Uncharacterized protein n=1 Tax=Paenibacillus oralis TaxID=2490856 RepID=A0A3P3TA13_9BACL|nr:hypothetical protein [Paenibacillus oralis]RRJ54876.1 hypothetical protein EHV15_35470 [Paenibacillus oralis]
MQLHRQSTKMLRHLAVSAATVGSVFFFIWTIINGINFFGVPNPSWKLKGPFMMSVTGLFLMVHALFLIFYSLWARKTKSDLEYIYKMDRRVLFEKYSRVFINEELIKNLGHNPRAMKKLSQKDKREVFSGHYISDR